MQDDSRKVRLPLIALLSFILVASGSFLATRTDDAGDLPDIVDFNRHIRPILSANCYVCHGPDISTREAGLRLDLRDSATVELESGNVAVVPGHSSQSALIYRVTADDPEERMPPKELKKTLSPTEVALLRRWIDQGAEWQKHWSLIPPQHVNLPRVRRTWQVENEIDRFVVSELEKRKLAPAAEAGKEALIRRLSFVLTGLPPTPEGVNAFLEDESPDAYEKLVDRLLASPHFGERWARHWMDVVRYANTRGHEFDYPVIGANQYRDYLIRAFNEDVPYDQLITEHLAGDLLEHPRFNPDEGFDESPIGTVFYGLGEGKHSPVDTKIEEYERTDIIIDVTSKAFQGLTAACARCHDHKFDPIPTTDYYALYGIIKSSRYAIRSANITQEVREQVGRLTGLKQQIREEIAGQWLSEVPPDLRVDFQIDELPAVNDSFATADRDAFQVIGDFTQGGYDGWTPDGLAFEKDPAPGAPVFEEGAVVGLSSLRASSATVSPKLLGALRSPDFELEHDYITVRAAGREARIRVIMDNFQLIQDPIYGGLEAEVDTAAMQDYLFDLKMWKGKKMYLELLPARFQRQNFVKDDSDYIEAAYAVAHDGASPAFLEMRTVPERAGAEEAKQSIDAWRRGKAGARDVALINRLLTTDILSGSFPGMDVLLQEGAEIDAALPSPEVYMGVVDGNGADQPVFVRGSINTPSDSLVPRRGLTIHDETQAPYHAAGSGRMEFVQSLLSPDNPLTARVMVNRLWHHVFGKGIVQTVDNFGVQGKYPSHPELLDYLAVRFVEQGWSIKQMIREMVLSKTFRRSTEASEEALRADPENIYLQHYPVRRLEAEAIRDAMLVASGRFDPTMFGPDVPVYLTEFMEGRGRPARNGPLDGDGRRSVYLSIRRNFLQPFMLVFDMPIPFTTFGRRNVSNVPAQSLTLLNDPFVADQAEHWAEALVSLKELGVEQKIEQVYLSGLARKPRPEEVEEAMAFLEQQAGAYGIESGDILVDRRPWRDFCHTVYNMKEFIHLI